ncbi:MAG: GLPGLI family protein [Bacteroidales bacterium]|jgi:GLPGLI family protein|nr:GLPGLI family protein [Bacteroidales bacterium]
MKKNILLLLVLIVSAGTISAQAFLYQRCYYGKPYTHRPIDTCKYVVTYNFRYYNDTSKKVELHDLKDLEFGNKVIRYHSIWAEKMDSLGRVSEGYYSSFKKRLGLTNNQRPDWEDIYLNYPEKGTLFLSALINRYDYCYVESIPKLKWKITRRIDTILGYKCYCATTDFMGRDYTAWFSPDITFSYGPYKFNGLPGLILKIQDSQKFFTWTAKSIYTPQNQKIYLDQAETVKKVTYKQYSKVLSLVWRDYISLIQSQGDAVWGYTGKNGARVQKKPGDVKYPQIPAIEIK